MAGTRAGASVQGMQIAARFDGAGLRQCPPACVMLDITIDAGLHVYGQPIPAGCIPLSIDVAPLAG